MTSNIPDLYLATARRDFEWLNAYGLVETRHDAHTEGGLLVYSGIGISLLLAFEQPDGHLSCLVCCDDPALLSGGPVLVADRPILKVFLAEILRLTGHADQANQLETCNGDDPVEVVEAVGAFSAIARGCLTPILNGDWTDFQAAAAARLSAPQPRPGGPA